MLSVMVHMRRCSRVTWNVTLNIQIPEMMSDYERENGIVLGVDKFVDKLQWMWRFLKKGYMYLSMQNVLILCHKKDKVYKTWVNMKIIAVSPFPAGVFSLFYIYFSYDG